MTSQLNVPHTGTVPNRRQLQMAIFSNLTTSCIWKLNGFPRTSQAFTAYYGAP